MDTSSALFLLLPLLLLLVSLRWLFFGGFTSQGRNKRGPFAFPIIGHLHLLRPPAHHSLARLSALYGPDLLLRFGSRRVLIISSPSTAEKCFTTHDLSVSNRPFLLVNKHFAYDATAFAAAPYGPLWRNLRRLATTQLFSSARLSALSFLRSAEVCSLLRSLFSSSSSSSSSSGDGTAAADGLFVRVGIREKLTEMTFNMIMEMILGKKYFAESPTKRERFFFIMKEVFHVTAAASMEDFLPFLKWLGVNGQNKRMKRLQIEIDGFLQDMVEERRRAQAEKSRPLARGDDDDGSSKMLVNSMLSLQQDDPQYYNDDIIKGMIELSLIAGTDTTTANMEWTMVLLLNHPEAMKKVHEEIEREVGHQRLVIDSDLRNLKYLNNVIKETMRLFPPGPLLPPRETTVDFKIGDLDIPCGTMLMVNVYRMHRDPQLWKDPTAFKPERFEEGEGGGYEYLPFGAGRRKCPGDTMAMKAIGLVIAAMIQCFEWKRVGEEKVDLGEREGVVMPPAIPLEALYKPRQNMIHVLSQL